MYTEKHKEESILKKMNFTPYTKIKLVLVKKLSGWRHSACVHAHTYNSCILRKKTGKSHKKFQSVKKKN